MIERDGSTMSFDRQVLYAATRRHGCAGSVRYDLLAPHEHPLPWMPDAIAWSWAKGGEWRDQVRAFCTHTAVRAN